MKSTLSIIIFHILFGIIELTAQTYEWKVANTSSTPGERIIAVIDAGSIDSWDGINIFGEIYDGNGNWGYNVPTKSEFSCFINFSGFNYNITQSIKTNNIVLRLRKISDSIVHLIGYMPYAHTSATVTYKVIIQSSITSITSGNPNVVDSSGTLILQEPTYKRFFTDNVGIGTTNPDEKLSVNGNIHTKEVRVDLIGWSDFVFHKDYELPTLKEVEKHIEDNGHLKDMPSAKDVEENGILLGKMNAKLLQKIEELTLYVLSLKKENEKQNEQLKEQAKNIQKLKSITNHYDEHKQD